MTQYLYFILCFGLPLILSLQTNQIFEVNKFTFACTLFALISISFGVEVFLKKRVVQNIYSQLFWILSLLFFIFLGIATFLSQTPIVSFFGDETRHIGMFFLLGLFFISLITSQVFTKKSDIEKYILVPILLSGIIVMIWTALQFLFIGISPESPIFLGLNTEALSNRPFASLGNPNFLAQFLLFPLFISLYFVYKYWYNSFRYRKYLFLFIGILFFLALLSTGSRGALLGLLSGLIVFLGIVFIVNKSAKQKLSQNTSDNKYYYLVLLLGIIPIIGLWNIIYFNINIPFIWEGERSLSVLARSEFWNAGIDLWFQNPIFGIGIDMLTHSWYSVDSVSFYAAENFVSVPSRSHALFLDIVLMYGLIPLCIILYSLLSLLQKSIRVIKTLNTDLSVFILSLVVGLIGSWCFSFYVITDLVLFILILSCFFGLYFHQHKNLNYDQNYDQNNNQNIKNRDITIKTDRSSHTLFISCFLFSCFFLFFSHQRWIADRSLYLLQYEEYDVQQTWEQIKKAPYLQKNIITVLPYIKEEMRSELLELGLQYQYTGAAWSQILSRVAASLDDKEKALEYYTLSKRYREDNPIQSLSFIVSNTSLFSYLGIDINKEKKASLSNIPEYFFDSRNKEKHQYQKFWKHHGVFVNKFFPPQN